MSRSRRKKRPTNDRITGDHEQLSTDSLDLSADSRRPRRRRRLTVSISLFVLLLVLIYLLPTIIANTSLRNSLANRALQGFNGTVRIDSASLGWFSPIELRGVTAVDLQGQGLFRIEKLTTDRSLWALLTADNFGQITLTRPNLSANLRSDGTSNIEDAVAELFQSDQSESKQIRLSIVIEQASATIANELDGRNWSVYQVNGQINMARERVPLAAKLTGFVALGDQPAGTLQADVQIDPGSDRLTCRAGRIGISADQVAIDLLAPFISRYVEPMSFAGVLKGPLEFEWSGAGAEMALASTNATLVNTRIRMPRRLGKETISLERVNMRGRVAMSPNHLAADGFQCATDVGQLTADGAIDWSQLQELAKRGDLPNNNIQAAGELDVAKLTSMLPNTMQLQPGLRFESGSLQFSLDSRPEQDDRRIVFNAESNGITAIHQGRTIQWHHPVRAVAVIRQTPEQTFLESIECRTNFATVTGSASRDRGEVTIRGDLGRAVAELNQFFDLKGITAGGVVDSTIAWQVDEQNSAAGELEPLRIGGRINIQNPQIHWPGRTSWQQTELDCALQAAGSRLQGGGLRIDTGSLDYRSGQQRLTARLVEPVETGNDAPWHLDCQVIGPLEAILAQTKTLVDLPFQVAGRADAKAQVVINGEQLELRQVSGTFDDFRFSGYGLEIAEPQLIANGDGFWHLRNRVLRIPDASLATSAVSARAQQLIYRSMQGSLQGNLAFRADINRTLRWIHGPPAADSIQWFGGAEGNMRFDTNGDVIDGRTNIVINDLVAAKQIQPAQGGFRNASNANPWQTLFKEKQVTIKSLLQANRDFGQVRLDQTSVRCSALAINASGNIQSPRNSMTADIAGTWNPDGSKLKPLVDDYLGKLTSLEGVRGQSFTVQGPILPGKEHSGAWFHPDLKFQTDLSWTQGQLLGLPLGAGNCSLAMDQGVLSAESGSIAYSGGHIRLAPKIDFNGQEPVLHLERGQYVNQVQITPEICRGWLKYVAPILADATQAQGTFSIRTREFSVPLRQVHSADGGGVIEIHQGQVGPGPLAQQLLSVVDLMKSIARGQPFINVPQQTAWITIPEQSVPFTIKDGRVFHNGLEMQIGNVRLRTRGSVGMDQSVQMIAYIPIIDGWIGKNPVLNAMKGQELQIPIIGTVTAPRLDKSVIENLTKRMLQQSAENTLQQGFGNLIQQEGAKLENELLKGLDKIFGGGR